MIGHVVRFRNSEALGLDDHNMHLSVVRPAADLISRLERRYQFDEGSTRHALHEAEEFLRDLGWNVVSVEGWGICAGDYWVQPVLITMQDWRVLQRHYDDESEKWAHLKEAE